MKKFFKYLAAACSVAAVSLSISSCSKNDEPELELTGTYGLFIVNEGQWGSGNASLSIYNPETKEVENEAFYQANGMKLGDGAQSMTIAGSKGWIVVNSSNVVFAIDPVTLKEKGRITNLISPRYFHQVNENKAYVTQMYDNRIAIVNPSTYDITGYITVPDMEPSTGSTEQMIAYGDYVFCNCWSYQKNIIKIDTRTDEIVATLEVGIQPKGIALDCNGKLWVMTDGGGWSANPAGYEAPTLIRIDPATLSIEEKFEFTLGASVSKIWLNGEKDTLYWINGDVWEMSVNASSLPTESLIKSNGTYYYGLNIAPDSGDVYVSDAIDYSQNGMVYRYSSAGELIDNFSVGVCPSGFCWHK